MIRRSFLASAGLGPPVYACVSVPPQHGKTSLIQFGAATWLRERPQDPLIYITYNRDMAREKSRETRDLARLGKVPLREDSRSLNTWTTLAGGGFRARALVGGALTGTPGLRWVVIDDPYKNRQQAESAAYRRDAWQSLTSNVISRLHPTTSILVNHTRWHEWDLQGQLGKEQLGRWEFHNLEAINSRGEALWPEGMPLDLLHTKRAMGGEYEWHSLYQGQPRPREGKLFQGISYFSSLPSSHRVAIGVDLAYTEKTSSDWSVAVVMAESSGSYYVLEAVRKQCSAPSFADELKQLARKYPGAPMRTYGSATERGTVDFMRSQGVPLSHELALTDKYVRAQPFSAAWNGGRVFLPDGTPEGMPWRGAYTSVVLDFSGHGEQDDDVDASSAAFSLLPQGVSVGPPVVPQTVADARPRRDPAITVRGRGKLGTW